MSRFKSWASAAAALLAVALGVAAPARGQSDAPDDSGSTITVIDPPATRIEAAPAPPAPVAEPEPLPAPEPIWVHRKRPVLIAAGAVTFGASYIAALVTGFFTVAAGAAEPCSDCGRKAGTLLIPIAGPWLVYRHEPGIWPAAWSGVEAVGAALLLAGLAGHDVLEMRPRYWKRTIAVIPLLTGQQQTLSLNVSW